MAKIALSDVGLRSLKPPPKGQKSYWDAKLPTFGVRVSQGGAKTFVVNRHNNLITIGRFQPGVFGLSEARTEAKRLLAEFTLGKVRPQSITVQQAVELFLGEKKKGRRPRTVADLKDRLTRHFSIKGQLADVTHGEIVRRLNRIDTPAEHNAARRVGSTFFTWCMNRRYITDNPMTGIERQSTQSRDRVLTDAEIKKIWDACSEHHEDLPAPYRAIVKLLICCGQRRGEIAGIRTSFVDDTKITLPATLTKNGREHVFPLSKLVSAILQDIEVDTKRNDALFFPARGKPDKPFNGWSKAMKALREALGADFRQFTLHDLRRTYRSNLGRIGVAPHIAERLVNHVSARSEVDKIYDRYTYMPEMKRAVEAYETFFLHTVLK